MSRNAGREACGRLRVPTVFFGSDSSFLARETLRTAPATWPERRGESFTHRSPGTPGGQGARTPVIPAGRTLRCGGTEGRSQPSRSHPWPKWGIRAGRARWRSRPAGRWAGWPCLQRGRSMVSTLTTSYAVLCWTEPSSRLCGRHTWNRHTALCSPVRPSGEEVCLFKEP